MKRPTAKLDDAAVTRIAQVIHEAMRAWQRANGQTPAPAWARAPKWMKESTRAVGGLAARQSACVHLANSMTSG